MNKVLTARARRLDNGEWIVGHPFETWNYRRTERVTYMALDNPCEVHANGSVMNLRAVMIDSATLGYETGKRDKNGEMIYGGMILKVGMFGGRVFLVLWSDTLMQWILASRSGDPVVWLVDVNSSDNLEIVKEGE